MVLRVWKRWIALAAVCLLAASVLGCSIQRAEPTTASEISQQAKKPDQLKAAADELYKRTAEGDYYKARQKLLELSDLVAATSFHGITTIEGVDSLTDTVVQAKRIFNAVGISHGSAMKAAAQLRLAADALTHPNEPMWLQYYKILKEDTRLLQVYISKSNGKEALVQFGRLTDHYETIRTSVWISKTPEEAEKLDSLFTFLRNQLQAKDIRYAEVASGLKQLDEALNELFRKSDDRAAYIPAVQPDDPVKWSLTIGSLIIFILGYAAWRMFRSDRNLIRSPRRNDGK